MLDLLLLPGIQVQEVTMTTAYCLFIQLHCIVAFYMIPTAKRQLVCLAGKVVCDLDLSARDLQNSQSGFLDHP